MLILYNILHILILIPFLPVICLYIALKSKYRKQIPKRLGIGLQSTLSDLERKDKTIWLHALSVGEVTSAVPLVTKINQNLDNVTIIFSASTQSGYALAEKLLADKCDRIVPFPLDILTVVNFFIKQIDPDLFILVETDFWPNLLHKLQRSSIPALLVNGRISQKSLDQYHRFSFFFSPMFRSFSHICVQTDLDKRRFMQLGLPAENISKIGNLKYASALTPDDSAARQLTIAVNDPIVIAGSTHEGEETILLNAFLELREKLPLKLIIAPRNITRVDEIIALAQSRNLEFQLRSAGEPFTTDVFILDTIGELISFYGQSTICFVGGSLVDEGGHNPLEPASQGKPVLFGPNMTDFEEIREDLIQSSGGFTVTDQTDLTTMLRKLLEDKQFQISSGESARNCVLRKKGLLRDYLDLIEQYL